MRPDEELGQVSIEHLSLLVALLLKRAGYSLGWETERPPRLSPRYLRRKPGRGLVVLYQLHDSQRSDAHGGHPFIGLTIEEQAIQGTSLSFTLAQTQQSPLEITAGGGITLPEMGLAIQSFPADEGFPLLEASCNPAQHELLFQALEQAALTQLDDATWRLIAAHAEPVRYKPGNRCVIRYRLTLERAGTAGATRRHLAIFGKVYARADQARAVYAFQQHLYEEQTQGRPSLPTLPRPLGLIEVWGLTLHEAIEGATEAQHQGTGDLPAVHSGSQVLQPKITYEQNGTPNTGGIPVGVLENTASALARLHTSSVDSAACTQRTGTIEARRLLGRADLLAGYYPAQAEHIQHLAHKLARRLETLAPDGYRLAHGGFKPSQLLIRHEQVFIVDFDGFCLADPALDVGYFLAYLRPSGLWYQRPGTRQWLEAASAAFLTGYRQSLHEYGVTTAESGAIVERAAYYEAALLYKIATRRVNRLNSPRPLELAAMLSEIDRCLSGKIRGV